MTTRRATRTRVPSIKTDAPLGSGPAIENLEYSWVLSLEASNRSEHTLISYRAALRLFVDWLTGEHLSQAVDSISREHVERFVLSLRDLGYAPSTVATRYRGLHRFFAWAVEEGEIRVSPMDHMHEPKIPERPRKVISEDELRALLAACEGKDFASRRDMALVRVLIDTGMRRAEIAGICLEDIDWQRASVLVRGKGDRSRWCKLGKKALRALDSYRRVRLLHQHAGLDALWLTQYGALTDEGLNNVLERLAETAGIGHIHAHLFRHTFADQWLASGGQEGDLMELGGWRSVTVMYRYGRARRAERAAAAHEKLSPGDRL